jgi:hypothetical protein
MAGALSPGSLTRQQVHAAGRSGRAGRVVVLGVAGVAAGALQMTILTDTGGTVASHFVSSM